MNSNSESDIRQGSSEGKNVEVDRPFTYKVTVASILVGGILAAIAWVILFSLARPSTLQPDGKLNFSLASLLFPLSLLVAAGIMLWAVFSLPVRIAKRRGVILDPEVWPWTGAVIVGVLTVVGFVVAILTGVI